MSTRPQKTKREKETTKEGHVENGGTARKKRNPINPTQKAHQITGGVVNDGLGPKGKKKNLWITHLKKNKKRQKLIAAKKVWKRVRRPGGKPRPHVYGGDTRNQAPCVRIEETGGKDTKKKSRTQAQ